MPTTMPLAKSVRERALSTARIGFLATAVLALLLGFWGLEWHSRSATYNLGRSFWDLAYYDLQLFVLGSAPLDSAGPFPWPLQVARFLAPMATIYALFEAARVVFASEWRRMGQRRKAGHTIVVGETPVADAMVDGLRRSGRAVLRATAGDAESLRDAGVAGARFVYACADDHDDSSVNVLAAALARQQTRTKKAGDLNVYAHVSDPTYALALRARHLSQPVTGADFFNIDELAAREVVKRDAGSFGSGNAVVVVAGLGPFGQSIVVELARMWQVSARAHEKLEVVLVDPDAVAVEQELRQRWPAIAETCELKPVADLARAFRTPIVPIPHRVYLCHQAEDEAVRAALTMASLWRGGERSIVVRLDRLSGLADVFGPSATSLLDDVEGRLHTVCIGKLVVGTDASGTDRIHEDIYERLAQLTHHNYLRRELQKGNTMGSSPTMVAWEELADEYKNANVAQTRDIGRKLAAVGCTVAPRTDGSGVDLADDPLLDVLAEHEHERWMDESTKQGWTWGEQRDNTAKRHPSLIPWEKLSEAEQEKDRAAVREIDDVLADCGLQIVRFAPAQP
ncbi:RyR domain-containing protein [Dactylosporangium sp. CA-092794]|uniref:RyR domain-containing protein n=1 Tax=Dactylosporangium sp. CA-092794 TaxID=3239929 RepID=UPI003D927360